jgi:hypothetical protein
LELVFGVCAVGHIEFDDDQSKTPSVEMDVRPFAMHMVALFSERSLYSDGSLSPSPHIIHAGVV